MTAPTLCPSCGSTDVEPGSSHFICRRCPEIWPKEREQRSASHPVPKESEKGREAA